MSTATQSETEANKNLVLRVAEILSTGRPEPMLELLDEEGTWWTPLAGTMSKPVFGEAWAAAGDLLKAPMSFKVVGITGEGDRVAVEMESSAELKNGNVYANKYHMLFVLRKGKILAVKEYLDTQHVIDVFGESPKP